MKPRFSRFLAISLVIISSLGIHAESSEPVPSREQRLAWWQEARFGLFIHWGLYAIPAGEWLGNREKHPFLGAEWLMAYREIPIADYKQLASKFQPTQFDAESWVLMAKDAGMKYLVFTAKHHDGFALFDSAVSDFNVVEASPFRRDVVRELAEACQKHGMKFGLYYSQAQDWSHPGGSVASFMKPWDQAHQGDFVDYVRTVSLPQVRELLTKYGPISVIWWDTPEGMTPDVAKEFREAAALQPEILQNSRLSKNERGDFLTMEGHVPTGGPRNAPWEVCVVMNGTWGFSTLHTRWKSSTRLLRDLIQTVSEGGNYLLNVGPNAEGAFPPEARERLEAIGAWMKVYGAAISGAGPSPLKRLWQQGRITTKAGKAYASIFLWPTDGRLVIPVRGDISKVVSLQQPEKPLTFQVTDEGVIVDVRDVQEDRMATVIALDIEGKLIETDHPPLSAREDGVFDLLAIYARISGADSRKPSLSLGKREGTTKALDDDPAEGWKLGGPNASNDRAAWDVHISRAAEYEVVLHYGLGKDIPEESVVEVRVGDKLLKTKLDATRDAQTFHPLTLGTVNIQNAGTATVSMSLPRNTKGLNIWRIELIPVISEA